MESRVLRTAEGNLELVPATVDELRGIARYWPMELVSSEDDPGRFGLVFQHGDREVHGVKLQPPDVPEPDAKLANLINRILIAAALPAYLAKGHSGVMVPCAYYKQKAEGMAESGIAFFVGPDPGSRSKGEVQDTVMYDDRLGEGATAMIFDMVFAIGRAVVPCGLPLFTIIGMDLRPRLAIGSLSMHFAVAGPRVIVIKDPLHEEERVWEHVVRAGFTKLPYAPMRPAGFHGDLPANARHV